MTTNATPDERTGDVTVEHIRHSNLIEGIADPVETEQSMIAWRFIKHKEVISLDILLQLHRLVMLNHLPHEKGGAGSFRIHNVTVGGRSCPHYIRVPELINVFLRDFEYWADLDPKTLHIRFERIHPFIDGNGRVGRLLMWWHEVRLGKVPTFIDYDDRWEYYYWFVTRADREAMQTKHFKELSANSD